MQRVFIGSEALAAGALTRSALRWNYRRILPDVYVPASAVLNLRDRTIAAWLWSRRRAVIAGAAAAALHGAQWVDAGGPIELIWRCGRPPPGIVVRNEQIDGDEVTDIAGMLVTTPERTAFDLARHLPLPRALPQLDALARATGMTALDALPTAERFRGGRGTHAAIEALSLMDGGARSEYESSLRLHLMKKWRDVPRTQIRVADGDVEMFIGVGYEEPMVGLDIEGKPFAEVMERQGLNYGPVPWLAERTEFFEGQGWRYIYVMWEDGVGQVIARVARAFRKRGYQPRRSTLRYAMPPDRGSRRDQHTGRG